MLKNIKVLIVLSLLLFCFGFLSCEIVRPYIDPQTGSTFNFSPVKKVGITTNGKSASKYIVRPESGANFQIKVSEDSDIWYLFSSASNSSVTIPPYNTNFDISPNNLFVSSAKPSSKEVPTPYQDDISPKRPIKVDSPFSTAKLKPVFFVEESNYNRTKDLGARTKSDIPKATDDYVGRHIKLYEHYRGYVDATCKLVRTVNTANGKRKLIIYEEDNMKSSNNTLPTSKDYKIIADAFLKPNLNNDIYDKLALFYGNDWGYCQQKYKQYYIPEDDCITLFFANIGNQGDPTGQYTAGYFYGANNYVNGVTQEVSNERNMVTLHAHVSGGEYLGECLTTIAHEFQHLIHNQYFDTNSRPSESGSSLDECFAALAEDMTAEFIAEKSSQIVPGPFYVGEYAGARNTMGYLPNDNGSAKSFINGRGPYFLAAMDNMGMMNWYDNNLKCYGLVASFAHWYLVNYGATAVNAYMKGDKADLEGLAEAINKQYTTANTTPAKMIADWGTACLLSCVENMSSPYSMNKKKWYNVGIKVPSVNMWNYKNVDSGISGIPNSTRGTIPGYGANVPKKVCENVAKGQTFKGVAPNYGSDIVFTVVAVPHR